MYSLDGTIVNSTLYALMNPDSLGVASDVTPVHLDEPLDYGSYAFGVGPRNISSRTATGECEQATSFLSHFVFWICLRFKKTQKIVARNIVGRGLIVSCFC